jgi:alanine-glyoxylate transaminase/serine-glyoxylate transaminase/serine-pyruvate transaminase
VVNGYFGERLAEMCRRYGADVGRVEVEWGRAVDAAAVRTALAARGADLVTVVHAETSTGVLNPVEEIAGVARERGAAIVVDAVTSLGAHPVEVARWGLDACYSCTQKGLGAPSGLAPLTVTGPGLARRVEARSFYLDLRLIEDFWVRRKYHHTISAPLVYALREALLEIEDEGLDARWARHRRHHQVLVSGLAAMDLHLLPPASERLWTIAAVKVPAGVDEAALRRHLLAEHNIEIGAGLGPLAGRIWRLGLMGTGSSVQSILLLVSALEHALRAQGHRVPPGAGTAAVVDALDRAASVA